MFVERIAVAYWRLRRVLKVEKGRIRWRLDRITEETNKNRTFDALLNKPLIPTKEEPLQEVVERQKLALSLPMDDLDVLMRYETALERQFYKALEAFVSFKQRNHKLASRLEKTKSRKRHYWTTRRAINKKVAKTK